MIGDYIFESFDKNEVLEFQKIIKPDYWERCIRQDPATLKSIYVLSWTIVDNEELNKALKRWKEHENNR